MEIIICIYLWGHARVRRIDIKCMQLYIHGNVDNWAMCKKNVGGQCIETTVTDWSFEVKCDHVWAAISVHQSICTSWGLQVLSPSVEEGKVERKALVKMRAGDLHQITHISTEMTGRQSSSSTNMSWQIPASSNCFINLSSSKFVCLCMGCNPVHQNNSDGLH